MVFTCPSQLSRLHWSCCRMAGDFGQSAHAHLAALGDYSPRCYPIHPTPLSGVPGSQTAFGCGRRWLLSPWWLTPWPSRYWYRSSSVGSAWFKRDANTTEVGATCQLSRAGVILYSMCSHLLWERSAGKGGCSVLSGSGCPCLVCIVSAQRFIGRPSSLHKNAIPCSAPKTSQKACAPLIVVV